VPKLFTFLCNVSKCGATFSNKQTRNTHHQKCHNLDTIPVMFVANVPSQKAFKMKIGTAFNSNAVENCTMIASGVPKEIVRKNSMKNLKNLTGIINIKKKEEKKLSQNIIKLPHHMLGMIGKG